MNAAWFEAQPATADDFTIVHLPDTQNYCAFNNDHFSNQAAWIVANAVAENIKMVVHSGDVVQSATSDAQWAVAMAALNQLATAGVPTLIVPGNHDYAGDYADRVLTKMQANLPATWYTAAAWWNGGMYDDDPANLYQLLTVGTVSYVFITLEHQPRAEVLTWFDGLLTTYAARVAIVFTHNHLRGNVRQFSDDFWNVCAAHGNIRMIGNGHNVLPDNVYSVGSRSDVLGAWTVFSHMMDFEDAPEGGEGYLRLIKFKPNSSAICHYTYSPSLIAYRQDADEEFVQVW